MNTELQEHSSIEVGSNKSFGLVFTAVFTIIGLFPLISGNSVRVWSLSVALIFLLVTFIAPSLLTPLNRAWFKLGIFLGRIINPIIMFVIYVTTVLPIGLLLRLFGKDLLSLKFTSEKSYWVTRTPPGPEPDSLKEQF